MSSKPFLKWVGGKTQIIENIVEKFPKDINNYYEPFVGGGSVLIRVLELVEEGKIGLTGHVYASDVNERLIWLYKNIQSNVANVVKHSKELKEEYENCEIMNSPEMRNPTTIDEARTSQESWYYWVRKQYNSFSRDEQKTALAAAMFIFLNKTCFRGLYREGPRGFNVPFGNYKNPNIFDEGNLAKISKLIKDVNFVCCSFDDILKSVVDNDFVYLDPPYAPENEKSFVGYVSDGFDVHKHKMLFDMCQNISKKNVSFVMSNADVEMVRNNFTQDRYMVEVISCKRAINSKKPQSRTNEVIVIYNPTQNTVKYS
jgi:DNA adenine methylase